MRNQIIERLVMYLQGSLQTVFDALFAVGAIDPILKMDWEKMSGEMRSEPQRLHSACESLNSCGQDMERMVEILKLMDSKSIQFVALEVARELCELQERQSLH